MATDKDDWLRRLANNNPVDLEKLASVEKQLQELKEAGVPDRRQDYLVQRPLGRLVQVGQSTTLANVGSLTRR